MSLLPIFYMDYMYQKYDYIQEGKENCLTATFRN
jgi:hypothetical protein